MANEKYEPVSGKTDARTFITRGEETIRVIRDRILPTFPQPNLLLVGLGLDSDVMHCCYIPYKIAGFLEGKNVSYRMTMVDADPRVTADVLARKKLYMFNDDGDPEFPEQGLKRWREYLQNTQQLERFVEPNEVVDDLKFYPHIGETDLRKDYIEFYKIFVAAVTKIFLCGLDEGTIQVINNDIVVAGLPDKMEPEQQYHFCDMLNVFYLLSSLGQQLALENISRSLVKGGSILFDDGERRNIEPDTPLLKEFGGWLGRFRLRQLGLKLEVLEQTKQDFFGRNMVGLLHKL